MARARTGGGSGPKAAADVTLIAGNARSGKGQIGHPPIPPSGVTLTECNSPTVIVNGSEYQTYGDSHSENPEIVSSTL